MKETDWHHAPLHRFVAGSVHMITAGTFEKKHLFLSPRQLRLLQETLLNGLHEHGWAPHAWACLSNHYHLIAKAPEQGNLSGMMQTIHSRLGMALNEMDQTPGRQVMYQFWDRSISFDKSYYARLNYVIHNPVKHGLVDDARVYPYCSAAWFEQNNPKSLRRRVYSYKWDQVNEPDDFEAVWHR